MGETHHNECLQPYAGRIATINNGKPIGPCGPSVAF